MLFIFDMGGVVTNDGGMMPAICAALQTTEERFFGICAGGNGGDIFSRLSNGEISSAGFWSEFSARSGKRARENYWEKFFNPVVDEKTAEIVRALKKNNRVVCGTNTIDDHFKKHIARGDYDLFDSVYASNKLGVSKPSLEFWEKILRAENARASDAIFIDDRAENCAAASSLGIKSILFTGAENLREPLAEFL